MKRTAWFLEACLYVALSVPLAVFPLKFGEFLGILLFISGGAEGISQ